MTGLLKSVQAALIGGREVSLHELLYQVKVQGQLGETLQNGMKTIIALEAAEQEGITASDAELQAAADEFRRDCGLHSAAETRKWLMSEGLEEEDFEAGMKCTVLMGKLRQAKVKEAEVRSHFDANRDQFKGQTFGDEIGYEISGQLFDIWLNQEAERRNALLTLPSAISEA